jgi:hypothetical protein
MNQTQKLMALYKADVPGVMEQIQAAGEIGANVRLGNEKLDRFVVKEHGMCAFGIAGKTMLGMAAMGNWGDLWDRLSRNGVYFS